MTVAGMEVLLVTTSILLVCYRLTHKLLLGGCVVQLQYKSWIERYVVEPYSLAKAEPGQPANGESSNGSGLLRGCTTLYHAFLC